jgi:hypothetical protein
MHLGRLGVALGIAASVMGSAWAAVPGTEGLMQIKAVNGQAPVQPDDLGMASRVSSRVTRYAAGAPRCEFALPTEWQLYRGNGDGVNGELVFVAAPGGPADDSGPFGAASLRGRGRSQPGRSGAGGGSPSGSAAQPRRWPDGSIRLQSGRDQGSALTQPVGGEVNGMVVTIGRQVPEAGLQELRAFATRQRAVAADGRQVEIYSYKLYGSGPKEAYNVVVGTTVAADQAPGKVDFCLVYYPAAGETNGVDQVASVAQTFRSLPLNATPSGALRRPMPGAEPRANDEPRPTAAPRTRDNPVGRWRPQPGRSNGANQPAVGGSGADSRDDTADDARPSNWRPRPAPSSRAPRNPASDAGSQPDSDSSADPATPAAGLRRRTPGQDRDDWYGRPATRSQSEDDGAFGGYRDRARPDRPRPEKVKPADKQDDQPGDAADSGSGDDTVGSAGADKPRQPKKAKKHQESEGDAADGSDAPAGADKPRQPKKAKKHQEPATDDAATSDATGDNSDSNVTFPDSVNGRSPAPPVVRHPKKKKKDGAADPSAPAGDAAQPAGDAAQPADGAGAAPQGDAGSAGSAGSAPQGDSAPAGAGVGPASTGDQPATADLAPTTGKNGKKGRGKKHGKKEGEPSPTPDVAPVPDAPTDAPMGG